MRLAEIFRQIFGTTNTRRLGPAGWLAIVALCGFLAVAIWYASAAWRQLAGVGISPTGWVFLGLGIVMTIIFGAGLMGLLFYSSRKGRDF